MTEPLILKELSDNEFDFFRDIVYREAGINLSDLKKSLLQSRLLRRLRALKLDTFQEYKAYFENNYDHEIIEFINVITTNKTDFFREQQHFDFMLDTVLPGFESSGKNRIRIWSAGSSTGEEAYSIAITLLEYYQGKPMPDIKILATDIDTQVLQKGSAGIYKEESIQGIDPGTARKYFMRGTGENEGFYKVKESVRELVTFRRLNLLDFNYPMKGKFDMIFCRNVIIYFDKPTQRDLFNYMHHFLDDDGYLCVGHSENLSSVTEHFHLIGRTIYKKDI